MHFKVVKRALQRTSFPSQQYFNASITQVGDLLNPSSQSKKAVINPTHSSHAAHRAATSFPFFIHIFHVQILDRHIPAQIPNPAIGNQCLPPACWKLGSNGSESFHSE